MQGVSAPPAAKKAKTDYEKSHRKRKFIDSWTTTRPWLKYNADENTMTCAWCTKYKKDGREDDPFIKGSSNFKLEAVKSHETSKVHEWSKACHENSQKDKSETAAGRSMASLTKAQRDRISLLTRTTHSLAKKARPFKDFKWHCE